MMTTDHDVQVGLHHCNDHWRRCIGTLYTTTMTTGDNVCVRNTPLRLPPLVQYKSTATTTTILTLRTITTATKLYRHRARVKVEVAVLGSPSLIVLTVSVDVKLH